MYNSSAIIILTMISVEYRRKMKEINIIILLLFCVSTTWTDGQVDVQSIDLNEVDYESDYGMTILNDKLNPGVSEKVSVKVYYETYCAGCIMFETGQFAPVVETMSSYLDIKTYPFGNAKIFYLHDNKVVVRCQNGPPECYGNKLHACALDSLEHMTAVLFNICLMNGTNGVGSDDESADRCGKSMKVDSEKIKACAKGDRGLELLVYYGKESEKAHYHYVPYILINGKVFRERDDFKKAVCAAFTNPPPSCTKHN